MRDPDRIYYVLDALREVWELVPDWRFMQLMCNLQRMHGSDMFYVEDTKLIEILNDMTKTFDVEEL